MREKFKESFRAELLFFLLFCLLCIPLLVHFNWPFARDTAVYVEGFSSFLEGQNPYESGVFRAGLFGSSFLYALASLIPQQLESLFFLSLNVLGVRFFITHFLSDATIKLKFSASVLVIWSSINREGLNTIQIMGILLGLQVFMLRALDFNEMRPQTKLEKCIGVLSTALALDLKPHLVLPMFIILVLRYKKYSFLVYTSLVLLLGHALIDSFFGKILTFDWIRLVLGLANQPIGESRADFVNIWSLIFRFADFGNLNRMLPYLLIALIILFVSFKRNLAHIDCVYVGLCLPLLSTYSHLYDYLGVVAVAVAYMGKAKSNYFLLFLIPYLTVTQNWKALSASLLVLLLLAFCVITVHWPTSSQAIIQLGKRSVQSILFYISIHSVQDYLSISGFSEASLSATCILFLITFMFFKTDSRMD